MALVNRHSAGIEFGDAFTIDVRANDFVASLGEARSGNQAYVSTTDDGKTHSDSPLAQHSF
jgi:hypothetical protein